MTAAYVALAMVQTSKTLDTQEGTCGVWKSQDALSSILVVTVWELTDDVPVKSDYGFPFTFAVDKAGLRTTMATGYAHTLKEACEKALIARNEVLSEAVREAKPNPYMRSKLADVSKR
jgi:hypothetical protein